MSSTSENISKIAVYDLTGRMRFNKNAILKKSFTIDHLAIQQQLIIVSITLENGTVVTKKLLD